MRKPILYIDACVRKESRTGRLAENILARLEKPYDEVRLEDIDFSIVNEDYLNRRERDDRIL